jgi:hypothetical protein
VAYHHKKINDDHGRRKAAVHLAALIGAALCHAEHRPLDERGWIRLERLRLKLDALRNGVTP